LCDIRGCYSFWRCGLPRQVAKVAIAAIRDKLDF
jgi:hypothetical protein